MQIQPTDLALHCLLRQGMLCSAREGLNQTEVHGRFHFVHVCVPHRQKLYLLKCAPSVDLDQPAHSHNLIRIFTGAFLIAKGAKVWADCTEAQAELSLHW